MSSFIVSCFEFNSLCKKSSSTDMLHHYFISLNEKVCQKFEKGLCYAWCIVLIMICYVLINCAPISFIAVSNGSSPSTPNGNPAAVAPSTPSVTSTMPVASPATLAVPPSSITAADDTAGQTEPKASAGPKDLENKPTQLSDSEMTEGSATAPVTSAVIPLATKDVYEPFDWKEYLKQTNSYPAPSNNFKQVCNID